MHKMTCRDHDDSSSQPRCKNEPLEFEPLKFYCISAAEPLEFEPLKFYCISAAETCFIIVNSEDPGSVCQWAP